MAHEAEKTAAVTGQQKCVQHRIPGGSVKTPLGAVDQTSCDDGDFLTGSEKRGQCHQQITGKPYGTGNDNRFFHTDAPYDKSTGNQEKHAENGRKSCGKHDLIFGAPQHGNIDNDNGTAVKHDF